MDRLEGALSRMDNKSRAFGSVEITAEAYKVFKGGDSQEVKLRRCCGGD